MSSQRKLTAEDIDYQLNLVREHCPEVFEYEEEIASKALNRIQKVAKKEGCNFYYTSEVTIRISIKKISLCDRINFRI